MGHQIPDLYGSDTLVMTADTDLTFWTYREDPHAAACSLRWKARRRMATLKTPGVGQRVAGTLEKVTAPWVNLGTLDRGKNAKNRESGVKIRGLKNAGKGGN